MSEPDCCRSCRAPIYWLKHWATGKLAPVDAGAVPDGNLVLDLEAGSYCVLHKNLFETDERPRHKNHFATCPDAQRYHKTK